ncbi:isoprenylcysteine carboxylmethyltransferase family protein [Candidatus Bathyarchaeota archaeon]|nr:isoprenylcysteine carboxylmethyltransferase family protein [Candidatus Bathyarchaeota archaeon]MBS7613476.1 isoprenylcysteine carboxylmethyltransferase family protein [Candidatus Bathyarchaeota archaeon]MBS7617462.1 isoprenylcysteine carboxylmethyltransferase family protein [Candidatus Bathyarchaeota archaeon]
MRLTSRRYEFTIVITVVALLMCVWTSRFGFSLPPLEAYMVFFREDAWLLVFLGLIATASALFPLFLEFKLSKSVAFIGWVFYFPVFFNTLIPMFILFFSVIGVFYTPWLMLVELDFANRIINGIIRLPDEDMHLTIDMLGYILIAVGLIVYSLSLYQLLSHAKRGRTLLTKGLYGITRHPQYFGIFLWALGFSVSGWRLINYLMWLTLCYSYLLLAEYEEFELEKFFGQEYLQYRDRVPFIIPLLKLKMKSFSRATSSRKMRLLVYTLIYILSLVACYYILDPFIVMYR